MKLRPFGDTGMNVSEIGLGAWQLANPDWGVNDRSEALRIIQKSLEAGCTFFDTAWGYGKGHSETLLGELVREHPDRRLYTATKIPPRNMQWPSRRGVPLDDVFPADHIRDYARRSLGNLGLPSVDLLQFHVWEDAWAHDDRWWRAIEELRADGLIGGVGISLNRWEPWNGLETLRTGRVDAVQVIYNIFDQAPEDELLAVGAERPGLARRSSGQPLDGVDLDGVAERRLQRCCEPLRLQRACRQGRHRRPGRGTPTCRRRRVPRIATGLPPR